MYTRQGRGFTDQELGDHFGVGRDAIFRRRQKLETKYPFKETDRGRYRIDTNRVVSHIPVKPGEALVLYTFLRRSGRSTPFPKRYVKEALHKLAPALYKPMTEKLAEAGAETLAHPDDARREETLEKILTAWTEKRAIRLKYQALERKDETVWHTVSPYLIEPSPWSDSIYVIGFSSNTKIIIPFSLERVDKAVETSEPFVECDPKTEEQILKHAWGIWRSNRIPQMVQLRFDGYRAVRRLRESLWHPNQNIAGPVNYSYAIWQALVAEPQEMLPWIRGWGADVEVVEPEELREALKQNTVDLGKIYRTMTTTTKLPHQLPYAKTNPDNDRQIHLLLYHLVDVGQVALLMWQKVLTDSIRQHLAGLLDLSVTETGQFIAFIAALHDLGKAGPAYQKKYAPNWLLNDLKAAGFQLESPDGKKAFEKTFPHATVSTWVLEAFLPEYLGLEKKFARKIAVALGGHHGSWPAATAIDRLERESETWDSLRRDLFWEVRTVFHPPTNVTPPTNKTDLNIFLTIVSGVVSVADWVGSRNKECFGFVEQAMSTRQYALRSADKARQSLEDLGWFGWQPTGQTPNFGEVFAYLDFKAPRQVQARVIEATQNMPVPSLVILEAPTGIGKTEAALYLADSWLQRHAGRGLYVAMPTQATSNQMYGRVGEFLSQRYPDQPLNYHLVHGQAAWQDELKNKIELQTVGDNERSAAVQAESWFTPRKRTLLAPFSVGTVDQTFLSILQTRHFFVRLFGLSHKVIIFDEVHAYDTFMSTLFERLLTWLNAIGTSVIILSATLPAESRRRLVEAYTNGQTLTQSGEYPCLTLAAPAREPEIVELPKPADVTVQLAWGVGREPKDILAYLDRELAGGGCAAVICNTVGRAQEIYKALDASRKAGTLDIPKDDLILFHARFLPVWRKDIEQKVLAKFGKPDKDGKSANRPHKAIVVATQVIEQSLDLDFDLMLTDVAPIDLIIQRAGRLHRHERSETKRHGLPRRLVIIDPVEIADDGLPKFEIDEYVYARYVLLRSYYALKAKGDRAIFPADTTHLIEQVYGDLSLVEGVTEEQSTVIEAPKQKMIDDNREAKQKAEGQLILAPQKSRLLKQAVVGLDEDNPEIHQTFRAQTRDIDVGISLICLHRKEDRIFIHTLEGELKVNLVEEVPFHQIKYLQQNTITVQHKALFYHFVYQKLPESWQNQAALRHYRTVIFEDERNGDVPNYTLKLSRDFGLEIVKQEAQ
jgi:CRISPR-associated endonuclease/helicase Cas3